MTTLRAKNGWRLVVLCSLLLVPARGWAQSAATGTIAGVARDATGAVLPGVTVEAASPALIEKVRSVVTDDQGEYRIIELRPGTYTVTFTLPGFSTVRREGLELSTGFTATVDGELRVGAVEETITVTGASPVVDTHNVRTQNVLSRQTLDTLPTGKTIHAFASLTLGTTVVGTPQDVGGNQGEAASSIATHGGRNLDQILFMDGMTYNGSNAGGYGRLLMPNQMLIQEITLETSGQGASTETAGVQVNLIPKEGGNNFKGSFTTAYTNSHMQSDNLDDALRDRGLSTAPTTRKIYDYGLALGGPVRRDRLWFFTAHRWWGAGAFAPGNYFNQTPHTLFYTPDLSQPAYTDTYNRDHTVRGTWQATEKHKITGMHSVQRNCYCFFRVDQNVAPEATTKQWYSPVSLTQATWTYPRTNRLLLQAGYTKSINGHGSDDYSTLHDIRVVNASTGFEYGASQSGFADPDGPPDGRNHIDQSNGSFTASYVTGSHSFKTGFTWWHGIGSTSLMTTDPPLFYTFSQPSPAVAPVPLSVTYLARFNHQRSDARKLAAYIQDQWTVRRVTLNLGVRLDTYNGWVPPQSQPGDERVPPITFAGTTRDVPNWKDISPRVGGAWDLFGNGKTAIKGSIGRYVQVQGAGYPGTNPLTSIVRSASRVWNDANGDYVPQESELGPLSNSAFGTPIINTTVSDDVTIGWGVRPYNWTSSLSVQHELRPGLGLTASYYRRSYGNFQVTDNQLVTPADYDTYCLTAPLHPGLPGGGGNQICGYADIRPSAFGRVQNLVRLASDFGKRTEVYNGLEFAVNGRFGRGGTVGGGLSTGQTVLDSCFVVDSPQEAQPGFCHVTYPFQDQMQIKAQAVYPLPWNLQVSGVVQNLAGATRTGIPINQGQVYGDAIHGGAYSASNAQIAPSLGRNLGACGTNPVCTARTTVNLVPAWEGGFENRLTQVDLRLTKIVTIRHLRIQGMLDAYNIFNANTILSVISTVGSNYLKPTQIVAGRLFKFGAQVDF